MKAGPAEGPGYIRLRKGITHALLTTHAAIFPAREMFFSPGGFGGGPPGGGGTWKYGYLNPYDDDEEDDEEADWCLNARELWLDI